MLDVTLWDLNALHPEGIAVAEKSLITCFACRKENTVLRARVPADHVSVIPNATDTTLFTPDPSKRDKDQSMRI